MKIGLVIRKRQTQTTVRYWHTLVRMAKLKGRTTLNVSKDAEQLKRKMVSILQTPFCLVASYRVKL